MNLRRLFAFCVLTLVLGMGVEASAQTWFPPSTTRSWNTYVASKIPDNWQSIIGNGGTIFPGSGNAVANNYQELVYSYTMPFAFRFLNVNYPSGSTIIVSTNGFVSFANTSMGSASGSSWTYTDYYGYYWLTPYYATSSPAGQLLIMPFISSYSTSNTPNGGVYYSVTGSPGSRVVTFEWMVRDMYQYYSPGANNIGNFQAKLYEGTSKIQFFYSTAAPFNRGYYFYESSLAGIKNQGEVISYSGLSAQSQRSPSEDQRYFLFNNPLYGTTDTLAITGMRVQSGSQLDYYPYYYYTTSPPGLYTPNGPLNRYGWHADYPANADGSQIGYQLSPVLNDVSTDSVWYTPTRTANAYAPGSTITVNAKFTNQGGNSRQNVPVQADLYRNGTLIASTTSTIFPALSAQFGTSTISFPSPWSSPLTDVPGIYETRVYPKLSGDEDQSNDTARATFYISKNNDVMPYSILQPFPNQSPLFQKYPIGVGVPVEIRYLNIGLNNRTAATKVGYAVLDSSGSVIYRDSAFIQPTWNSITFRDVTYTPWNPAAPGRYYIKAYTYLPGDEQPNNDTLPRDPSLGSPFDVRYEIEIQAVSNQPSLQGPQSVATYAIGRPIPTFATFTNSGASDATNIPVRLQITGPNGTIVYDRTATVLNITGDYGRTTQPFPSFAPLAAGTYCAKAFSEYPLEPTGQRGNDTVKWCFTVKPALTGTIRVGYGERFKSIQEARDSMFFYGVAGPVTFELTDDSYLVQTTETSTPALDLRGRIIGVGPNAPILWRPVAGKSLVTINMKSWSGIGMWYGQLDTSNPSGYMTWDGGANHALKFTYENTQATASQPAYQRSLPLYFGQGSSNYSIVNSVIEPVVGSTGLKNQYTTIPAVQYIPSFNEFRFVQDLNMTVSAGIMLRNSAPIDPVIGRNWNNRDTILEQNNVFNNNQIHGFGYGILSVGAGPLFVVGTGRYSEYDNQSNTYSNNLIEDVTRGGVVVSYEKNSKITGNTIRRVINTSATLPDAAGIWATAGDNALNNRGNSVGLDIQKNKVSQISSTNGTGAAIWLETAENVFVTPANVVYRFPATGGATNFKVSNNMLWGYAGGAQNVGVGLTMESTTRGDFTTTGNRIENNTIYNQEAGTGAGRGVILQRAGGTVLNNIIALTSQTTNPTALTVTAVNYQQTVQSDYNAFWVPFGNVGSLQNLSTGGFALPSPAIAKTLNQWRALTGLDMNSVQGDVTQEFVTTSPGAEDLHIKTNMIGSIVNNRGTRITDLTTDIDGDPRGSGAVGGRYDIGADEFTGQVRNFDIQAEDVVAPFGYKATTGQFSDAEYVMADSLVPVRAIVRNVGGQPMTNRDVTVRIEWQSPTNATQFTQVSQTTKPFNTDVSTATTADFGTFMPQTLREMGLTDPFYGMNTNVTPVYRITVTTGTDDYTGNNTYSKLVRFYEQRSARKALVAVRDYGMTGILSQVQLSNKLNGDTLVQALTNIGWGRADGVAKEDYDLFDRTKWPAQGLNFLPWSTVMWAQGVSSTGLLPEERTALKAMLNNGNSTLRNTLIIAGQEVARIHDVALTATNGAVADQDFVRNYLRAQYAGTTNPAVYNDSANRVPAGPQHRIQGVVINPGKYEVIRATGVAGDADPMPSVLRTTTGSGVAQPSHKYVDQIQPGGILRDSVAGVASSSMNYNVVYYAQDWRHYGRFAFEPARSGAQRMLLGALDFSNQFRGILPVKLVSFEAHQSAEHAVTVNWKTASEVNVTEMQIERAQVTTDERGEQVSAYEVIAREASRGTATSGSAYQTVDPTAQSGAEYIYRLVTVNPEGVRTPEEAVRLKMSDAQAAGYTLEVLPNPVVTTGRINYRTPDGVTARIALYDNLGGLVREIPVRGGTGTATISATDLASGSYTLRLEAAGGTMLTRVFTVQK